MGEQLHFSMDGEFLTAIARDWFWNMDKPYKKCEELLLSCMMGGNEEKKACLPGHYRRPEKTCWCQ